jgi:hypothetical protein
MLKRTLAKLVALLATALLPTAPADPIPLPITPPPW